jgi:hypothetical protein
MWKKATFKTGKFLHLSSLVIAIPLDPLSIEILGFGEFIVARVRRTNNFYFVMFVDVSLPSSIDDRRYSRYLGYCIGDSIAIL